MHIAIVNEAYFKDSGIPTHIRAYVSELAMLGNKVSIFATDVEKSGNNGLVSFVKVRKTHHVFFKMLLFFRAIKAHLQTGKVDIIHAHDSIAFISCWLVGKIYKIPVVSTCHGTIYQKNIALDYGFRLRALYKITDRLVALLSARVVAISKEVGSILVAIGAKNRNIKVIPGIYEKSIFSIADQPKEFRTGKRTCLFVGALRPIKGVGYLVDAIPEVVKTIKDFELLLIGPAQSDQKEKVLSQINALGMGRYIKYMGYVAKKELADYYMKADLFIVPSLNEPQGLVILEAMSFALPVVASNIGGIPDMIKDGVNGLLVPPGDSGETARAIIKILSDKSLYEACSRGSWAYMNDNPSEKNAVDLVALYNDAIKESINRCPQRDDKIKVMHILLSLECGGAEKVAVNLIKKLNGDKFDFSVCVLDRTGALKDELGGSIKIECMNRKSGFDFLLPLRLAKAIRRTAPDVIHMHNSSALLYGTMAAKLAGFNNMIVTQHGSVLAESKKMQLIIKQLSKIVDKNITVSSDIEGYLKKHFGVKGEKVHTIINGIDDQLHRQDAVQRIVERRKFGLEDKVVIGHVARLSPEKDQKNLLEAFALVAEHIDNANLVIVGDGPSKRDLEDIAKKLKVWDKVIFMGFQRDIQAMLNMFDMFVLSSSREGTSLTLIEAMSTSLPVIATNVGGNPKVVDDKKTGLIVPPQDPSSLAQAMIYLCRNPKDRENMGIAGRQRVVEGFGLGKMADKYAGLYTELANK